jgi:predicted Rdx family selenoprotein
MFCKMWRISWLAEELVASFEEGLHSIELVKNTRGKEKLWGKAACAEYSITEEACVHVAGSL